jgi:transcriptional regulator with XRE-family HTH domain
MTTIPPGKVDQAVDRRSFRRVRSERRNGKPQGGHMGNIPNREQLRAMRARTKVPTATFAAIMGVSPRALYQYLAGSRRVPNVAISAAYFALFALGVSFSISGDEIRAKLGITP